MIHKMYRIYLVETTKTQPLCVFYTKGMTIMTVLPSFFKQTRVATLLMQLQDVVT